jgi:hypothetical protein
MKLNYKKVLGQLTIFAIWFICFMIMNDVIGFERTVFLGIARLLAENYEDKS